MELYRYMSFESFVDIIQSKELTFVYPFTSWDDGYEGMIFQALQTITGIRKINDYIYKSLPESGIMLGSSTADDIRCLCWSKSCDSIAMWSTYSYNNKAIMLKTDSEYIEQLKNDTNNIKLYEIEYLEDDLNCINDIDYEIEKSIDKFIRASNSKIERRSDLQIELFFTTKRASFKHENEVRAMTFLNWNAQSISNYHEKKPVRVIINNPINEFIKDVLVHPKAPDYFVDIVHTFCKNHKVKFSGKSDILQFKYYKEEYVWN